MIRNIVPEDCGLFAAFAIAVLQLTSCATGDPTETDALDTVYLQEKSGGETTIYDATSSAFTFPSTNIENMEKHLDGDVAFEAIFVAPPADINPGLGPIFNNSSCISCHVSNGRGRPPEPGQALESMLVRLSIEGENPDGTGAPLPTPGFGGQLNDKAVFGVAPEADVRIVYEETERSLADGETVRLRTPAVTLENPYANLPEGLMTSARVAPPVFGRGLLEAVPDERLLFLADPHDTDGDGISGRPNYVYDFTLKTMVIGRFGLKANQSSLLQQAAAAYRNDMGITNPIFETDSTVDRGFDDGLADDPELDLKTVEDAAFYTQTLAVPARRNVLDSIVQRGAALFDEAGCAKCHVPHHTTETLAGVPSVSNQEIYPYTDLLLHDLGEGLSDGRPDFDAAPEEWRTAPLWGIGLTKAVQGHTFFLHDGRARSLIEAIMWHAGEAESAREFVMGLSKEEREALLRFLESL